MGLLLGAHLARAGDLTVQPANEGSNTEGQGVLKNWQFGLWEHTSGKDISLRPRRGDNLFNRFADKNSLVTCKEKKIQTSYLS